MTESHDDTATEQVPLPQVGLTGPNPARLADLVSIARDLNFARRCAEAYAGTEPEPEGEDEAGGGRDLLRQALWNAGLISYRRAFTTGRGHILAGASRPNFSEQLLAGVEEEGRATHSEALEMANQHIAHRVGAQEGAIVVAMLQPAPGERAIDSIATLGIHMIGPYEEFAQSFVRNCEAFLESLQVEIDRQSDVILDDLRDSADLDDLYAAATTPGAEAGS